MFTSIQVIGRGRLGSALVERLQARGHDVRATPAELVVLCVPDAAISGVAQALAEGPWICHMSGATPLAACAPHTKRFSVHPLQTFRRGGGAEQFDGAWAAVTGESAEARSKAGWLAETLGLTSFALDDEMRGLYHAGAAFASNYLVTLHDAAARALEAAGAPPEALMPLMRRTMDNGFELTGPISRGDWTTVDAHLQALAQHLPDLEPLYRSLAEATDRRPPQDGHPL
ncbi:MAG: Rossmann-like and DUF2520 domain-containing protein [Vicinamibacterales bacterium]